MISRQEFEKEVEKRMKRIEEEVDKRLKYEIKEGAEITQLFQLSAHIKNPEIITDIELYEKIKQNEIAVVIEKLSDNLKLAEKATKICNKAKEKIPLAELSREDTAGMLKNEDIKKALDKARIKLVKLLKKETKSYEETRTKLIKKLREEEMKKIDEVLAKAYRLTQEGEKLEAELLPVLRELSEKLSADTAVKQQISQLTESETFDLAHVEQMSARLNETANNKAALTELRARRNSLENRLSVLGRQIESVIDGEFARKPVIAQRPLEEVEKAEKELEKAA